MEKELVRKLGEIIGYGNMMQLASECWKESMLKQGYPTTGVFIPSLTGDSNKSITGEILLNFCTWYFGNEQNQLNGDIIRLIDIYLNGFEKTEAGGQKH